MHLAYLFDAIIAAIALSFPLYLLRARKRGGNPALAAALFIVWAVVLYGSFIAPRLLATRSYAITLDPAGERSLRIAVISDTHLGPYKKEAWLARVVAETNRSAPDLVILAGDLVSSEEGMTMFGPLADLRPRFGTYAVLGNWDYAVGAVDVRKAIESTGVEVLTNEHVILPVQGRPVILAGLDDLRHGKPDWDAALAGAPAEAAIIVAAHNPDLASEAEVRQVDLLIAGHTHCGQIRLPLIGPVPPLPTRLGRHFDCGLFPIGPLRLFITPGVGESGPRSRLFQRSEISILEMKL